jgi:hypothetical protein
MDFLVIPEKSGIILGYNTTAHAHRVMCRCKKGGGGREIQLTSLENGVKCVYMCMHVCVHVYEHVHICVHVNVHVHVHVCVHVHVYLHACMYVCMYVYMYMYTCLCM